VGKIDTSTLATGTYETHDFFTTATEAACCNKCVNRGSGSTFCFGFRFDDTDEFRDNEECVLFLTGFDESSITTVGSKTVYMRVTNAPTAAPTAMPTDSPTDSPTQNPTAPTDAPTDAPTKAPTSAPTGACRDAPGSEEYDIVLGTIDLGTLSASKYVNNDAFTVEELGGEGGCCEACNNRADPGSASYCKGFR
jgi:hypothetical protein